MYAYMDTYMPAYLLFPQTSPLNPQTIHLEKVYTHIVVIIILTN